MLQLTSKDLDTICQMKDLNYIYLKCLHFNIQYIPRSCKSVDFFMIENEFHSSAVFNYTWPAFWSTSMNLVQLKIPRGKIDIFNIPKFINNSNIKQVSFLENSDNQANPRLTDRLPSFFFDGSLKNLIVFECIHCSLIGRFPYISNRSNIQRLDLRHNRNISIVLNSSTIQSPTALKVLRIDYTNIVGQINIPIKDLHNMNCFTMLGSHPNLKPQLDSKLMNVNGEVWLSAEVANLNYLLRNDGQNISTSYHTYRYTNVTQTTWRVNNMICKNYVHVV